MNNNCFIIFICTGKNENGQESLDDVGVFSAGHKVEVSIGSKVPFVKARLVRVVPILPIIMMFQNVLRHRTVASSLPHRISNFNTPRMTFRSTKDIPNNVPIHFSNLTTTKILNQHNFFFPLFIILFFNFV